MADFEGQEKTEQPTDKKLGDARKKGKVAKSLEINSLAVFGFGFMLIFLTKEFIGEKLSDFSVDTFSSLNNFELTKAVLQTYAIKWTIFFFTLMMPLLLGILVISLTSNIAQIGFKFAPKVFKIELGRFNPIMGVKRLLFSTHSLIEVGKSLVKLLIIGLFTYFIISKLILDTSKLVDLSIEETVAFMLDSAFTLTWKIVLFFAFIASADFVFQKMKFKKDMMMSKEEVKEEMKQSEGDPYIKSKIRKLMMQAAKSRMMKDIPTADVVITNPTHVAIALKYDMQKDAAPKVVAKGLDELAQRIKKIANENNVPLYEDVELARALYKSCDVGDFIPAKLFKAVAQILAYIFQLKKVKKQKSIV
ncbi:MAG: flagellar biosynthesis protein FlhB [Ignavibacteriales bacterium]|nr:flagellar biosynthesis protein FlhB [Ignavibacteriales bacterium]